jgi:hypothetical protein
MSLFFLTIFAIYGGMHAYVFLRARSAFAFGPVTGITITLFMLLMVFALFLIRALEHLEYESLARGFAYVAYFWMAVLFLFFCCSLVFDAAGLILRVVGWISGSDVVRPVLFSRISFLACLVLSAGICVYGYFEDRTIQVERVRIETEKLPEGIGRLSIVQVTDVHLGLIVRNQRLEKMLDVVREAKPDIFVSTGDLVDAQINHLKGLAEILRTVKATYGSYAVTGNHEYYAGLTTALAFTKEAGFTLLQNEAKDVGPITIAGVNDNTAVQMNLERPVSEKDLLAKLPRNRFILFLKHKPQINESTIGLFDLQISGHTHKGQIFPFNFITRLVFPMIAGTHDLGRGSLLHVSRGTGTWGPPVRFLAPPEITIYEVVRKRK